MILNLNNLISQVRRLLFDPDGMIWSTEQLTDFIRLALQELQTIATLKLTLEGLDAEETTTLEPAVTVLLVRMILFRAVEMRWLERSEIFHPDPQHGDFNRAWLEYEKNLIQTDFNNLRTYYLQRSTLPPFPTYPAYPTYTPIYLRGGDDA